LPARVAPDTYIDIRAEWLVRDRVRHPAHRRVPPDQLAQPRQSDRWYSPDGPDCQVRRFLGCGSYVADLKRDDVPATHRTSKSAQASIGRYKEELDSETLGLCKEHFGGFMEAFGYGA